jgi:hypothetical protein
VTAPVFVPELVECPDCDAIAVDHLDEEWAVACEAGFTCRDAPQTATWLVQFTPCCDKRPRAALWCTACKDLFLAADRAVCNHCEAVWIPTSAALTLIEPLNRRPQ